jgi:uncharacterized MAPEG superfamily protein
MVLVILLVLALFVVQTVLPNRFREPAPSGTPTTLSESPLGPRDHQRPLTVIGGRAERALANLQEALPVFLALALLNLILGTAAALALTGAWVFFIARVLYVPAYLAGIPVIRTLIWVASWVGLILMLTPLLDRI